MADTPDLNGKCTEFTWEEVERMLRRAEVAEAEVARLKLTLVRIKTQYEAKMDGDVGVRAEAARWMWKRAAHALEESE